MINKSFHNLLKGVSVLPALVVVPVMADQTLGFLDGTNGYVNQVINQIYTVLNNQNNTTGFQIGSITIGNDKNDINTNDNSLRYGVATREAATQYVQMEQVGLPSNFGGINLDMPLYGEVLADRGLRVNATISADGTTYNIPEVGGMFFVLNGNDYIEWDNSVNPAQLVGVTPHISNTERVLTTAVNSNLFGDRTWLLSAFNNAMQTGKIEDGYLYTDDNFVVDGNYGEMAAKLIDTYKDSLTNLLESFDLKNKTVDEINLMIGHAVSAVANTGAVRSEDYEKALGDLVLRDALGVTASELKGLNADKLAGYLDSFKTKLKDLKDLNLNVGEIAMNGGKVTFKNKVGITTAGLDVTGGDIVVDSGSKVDITVDDVDLTFVKQYVFNPSQTPVHYDAGDVVFSGGTVTIADGATLNITSTNETLKDRNLIVSGDANIVNNGALNINVDNVTVDSGATLNLGTTSSIVADTITLNGTINATLREGDDARFVANTFTGDGSGVLNLAFAEKGRYFVFDGDTFDQGEGIINVATSVYDIDWDGGYLVATVKSAADIADQNKISSEAAATVAGLADSSSDVLNDLAVVMQEKLLEGTPEAKREVEQATAAINPETESVAQSVASSVQTTVTNLASARMSMPTTGRSAGDIDLKAGGVWAQGLYNKSKMNDSFSGYTRGVAVGADGIINNDITVGVGYAFNHSDIASNSRDTEIDSNTIFVYGQYKPAEWYVNAVLNYTWSDYSEDGIAFWTPVTSEYDIGAFGAAVAGGYDFACGVTPELGLRYMHVNGETYTNNLGDRNKLDSTDYLTGTLGAKYGFNIVADEEMLFRPELRYAFKYDLVSDESIANVMMPGTAAYTLNGERLPRVGNEFGIGLTMRYRTMDLSLTYDIDVRKDYTSQTGMLKFRYNF